MKPWLALLAVVLSSFGTVSCGAGKSSPTPSRAVPSSAVSSTATAPSGTPGAEPSARAQQQQTVAALSTERRNAPVFNPRLKGDPDADAGPTALDPDDVYVLSFGPAAKPADKAAIAELLQRYFGALAQEEGSLACSLMSLTLESLIPLTYSQTSSSQQAGFGMTCAAVLARVFAGHHRELVDESHRLRLEIVRVDGNSAFALLRFAPKLFSRILLDREHGAWKLGMLQAASLG